MLKKIYYVVLNILPAKYRVAIQYYRTFKVWPDVRHPKNINEKILKRILFEKDPQFAFFADKYAVRQYIKDTIGENFLVPLIAIYKSAEELNQLSNWQNIVIKPTHGAGMVKIIDDESNAEDKRKIIQQAEVWLNCDFSKACDEWHYSLIKPQLVVEKKITTKGEVLRDYKFHRFTNEDGTFTQILQIIAERSEQGYETVFFNVNDLDHILHSPFNYQLSLSNHEKNAVQKILKLNEQLCTEYSYVRLDWYITKDQIYFGEITFTPGAGRSKSFQGSFGEKMGKLWKVK